MEILTKAFYEALTNDHALELLIGQYAWQPAVFTAEPIPEDVNPDAPYIVTVGENAISPFDTKTSNGHQFVRDITCFAPADGSSIRVERIADRIANIFHRGRALVPGYQTIVLECGGPTIADQAGMYGRTVTVRGIISKQ